MAIEKYSEENFERTVLEEIYGDIHEAVVAEEKWIAYYNAKHSREFYNLSENCGGFDKGNTHTEETKKLISESTSEAMLAMGREYYANRKQSGTGRAPVNKGKKFDKNSEEYKRIYGNRKPSSRPDRQKVKMLLEEWDKYIQNGGTSERSFTKKHRVSRYTLRKILNGTYICK